MNIPIKELKAELRYNTDECKKVSSYDNTIISKSVFGLFSKLINKFDKSKSYQTGLFVKSINDWLDRKDCNQPLDDSIQTISAGDIYMVDWNIGYSPELSYEHPCVIIEVFDDFIFALPVSAQKTYIEIAYHPDNNKDGDRNYRLVYQEDGFNKECVIHINQAKTISKTRILYKMGTLIINEKGEYPLLNELKLKMINKYFSIEYNNLLEENNNYKRKIDYLSEQRRRNQSRADKLRNENTLLRNRVNELEAILDKSTQL